MIGGQEFHSRFILGLGKYSMKLIEAAEPFLEQMAQRAGWETSRHFGNTVYLFTPLYIANYCENYCVYCGFNCYNHISRMKLTTEQMEKFSHGWGWRSIPSTPMSTGISMNAAQIM